MFLLYIIITLLLIVGAKVHRTGFHDGYISKEQCNCIKGFFIVVVFCRHIAPYLADAGYDFSIFGDSLFRHIDGRIGQLLVVMFLVLFLFPYDVKGVIANMRACLLAMTIVVLSMRVQVRSTPLAWLGKNLFPLYIYQRIGMIIFSRIDEGEFIRDYPFLYILICALVTLLFGLTYKYFQIKTNK